jgi:hypothetical protein
MGLRVAGVMNLVPDGLFSMTPMRIPQHESQLD